MHRRIRGSGDAWLRTERVGLGSQAFAVGHQQLLPIRCHPDRGRIPANRNETERTGFAGDAHIEDRHNVVVGVRDKESLFIWRKREAVRRRAGRGLGVECGADGFDGFAGVGVEHGDGVAGGIGDEEEFAGARQRHLTGMFLGRPEGDGLLRLQIEHSDCRLGPKTHVQPLTFFIEAAGVRERVVRTRRVKLGFGAFICSRGIEVGRGLDWNRRRRGRIRSDGDIQDFWLGKQLQARDTMAPDIGDV